MKRIVFRYGRWIGIVVTLYLLFAFTGCGGGYGTDSEDAPRYQHSLFGTDTSHVE